MGNIRTYLVSAIALGFLAKSLDNGLDRRVQYQEPIIQEQVIEEGIENIVEAVEDIKVPNYENIVRRTPSPIVTWKDIKEKFDDIVEEVYEPAPVNLEEKVADVDKPNAIIIIPGEDDNGNFTKPVSERFYSQIEQEYNVTRKTITSEDQLYETIENTPNVKLLIIGGHGDPSGINFYLDNTLNQYVPPIIEKNQKWLLEDDPDKRSKIAHETDSLEEVRWRQVDKAIFTAEDVEAEKYFNMLAPDAVIFLNSCSVGKGDLSTKVKQMVGPNRTVISATEDFSPYGVEVNSVTPLDVNIKVYDDLQGNIDVTRVQ